MGRAALSQQVDEAREIAKASVTFELISGFTLPTAAKLDFASIVGDAFDCECDFDRIEGHYMCVLYKTEAGSDWQLAVGACTIAPSASSEAPFPGPGLLSNFGVLKTHQSIGVTRCFLELVMQRAAPTHCVTEDPGLIKVLKSLGMVPLESAKGGGGSALHGGFRDVFGEEVPEHTPGLHYLATGASV